MPRFCSLFATACPTNCPGDRTRVFPPLSALLRVPHNELKNATGFSDAPTPDACLAEDLLHSLPTLLEHRYPLPCPEESLESLAETGFIELDADPTLATGAPSVLFAIDCEMCRTIAGLELTRVSVVNEQGIVVYDEFVKPANPILDYNTEYSGITAAHLESVERTVADVQAALRAILKREHILLGHSLENDLRALKIVHRRVLDTALLFSDSRGHPYKPALRHLAKKYLSATIQTDAGGHDSVEDATTVLRLVKLKLARGRAFGTPRGDTDSLFSKFARLGLSSAFVGYHDDVTEMQGDPVELRSGESDAEIVEQAKCVLRQSADKAPTSFVCLRLRELEAFHQLDIDRPECVVALQAFEERANALYDALPKHSMMIVVSPHLSLIEVNEYVADFSRSCRGLICLC